MKTKRFAIEPMFEEDAVAAMEDLGHDFYVFVNAETERLAVLYRRRDGDFGLIEPMLGGEYTPRSKGSKNGRRLAGRTVGRRIRERRSRDRPAVEAVVAVDVTARRTGSGGARPRPGGTARAAG